MKKTFILVLCLSMFIGQRSVLAKPMEIEEKLFQETLQQSKNVTGLLTDEYGNPIIGATILVKGTTQGVISDINGRFSIRVAVGETLSFSFIGYENVEKKVTSETEVFNIRMIEESTSLKDYCWIWKTKESECSRSNKLCQTGIFQTSNKLIVSIISGKDVWRNRCSTFW